MICDTSGLLAALWRDQPDSERCAAILTTARLPVISPFVLTEFGYLMAKRIGPRQTAKAVRHLASSGFELASLGWADVESAVDITEKYADLGIGLTDASLVVLSKKYRTDEILTLDQRHFRAIRSLSGRPFKLLPFDMD